MRTSAILPGEDVTHWQEAGDMRQPARLGREGDPAQLVLADASHRWCWGIKGPGAATWIASRGLPVPAGANRWAALPAALGGGVLARLGHSEFFLEQDGPLPAQLAAGPFPQAAYPVLHADTALVLAGARVHELLVQVCNIDFAAMNPASREVVMTSMVGVSVLVIPQVARGLPLYRIWCDPSFGASLHRTLLGIVEELGGGPLGLDRLAPLLDSATHPPGDP